MNAKGKAYYLEAEQDAQSGLAPTFELREPIVLEDFIRMTHGFGYTAADRDRSRFNGAYACPRCGSRSATMEAAVACCEDMKAMRKLVRRDAGHPGKRRGPAPSL